MAITLIDSNTNWQDTEPMNVTTPTHLEDDVAIAHIGYSEFGITFDENDGFTLPANVDHGGTGGSDRQGAWEWLVQGASEPANYSIGFSGVPTGNRLGAIIATFRGVDTANVLDVTPTTSHRTEGQDNESPTNDAITTVTDDAWVLMLCMHTGGSMTSYGAPTGATLVDSFTSGQINMGIAYEQVSSAGLYTPNAWNNVGTSTRDFVTHTLALRPATAAPPSAAKQQTKYGMAYGTWNR